MKNDKKLKDGELAHKETIQIENINEKIKAFKIIVNKYRNHSKFTYELCLRNY